MVVGVCHLALVIHECRSLKAKRQVLKSITAKVRNRFNVSISEVAAQDLWQRAEIGITAVGTDNGFVNSVIDKVINYIEGLHMAEIIDHDVEFIKVKPPWASFG